MKHLFFLILLIFGTSFAFGQKYGYIDSDFILNKMPEYKQSKEKLDKLAERWNLEIDELYATLKTKKDNFAREEVLLPTEERKKREEDKKE